MTIGIVDSIIN